MEINTGARILHTLDYLSNVILLFAVRYAAFNPNFFFISANAASAAASFCGSLGGMASRWAFYSAMVSHSGFTSTITSGAGVLLGVASGVATEATGLSFSRLSHLT